MCPLGREVIETQDPDDRAGNLRVEYRFRLHGIVPCAAIEDAVHIDTEGDWMILIENRCQWLQETSAGGRCVNYRNRPLICRGFSPATCDFTEGTYEFEEWFNTPEELEAYARRMLGEDAFKAARKKANRPRARRRSRPRKR